MFSSYGIARAIQAQGHLKNRMRYRKNLAYRGRRIKARTYGGSKTRTQRGPRSVRLNAAQAALTVERKYHNVAHVVTTIAETADATGGEQDNTADLCLNAIALGNEPWERDGRHVNITDVEVRGHLYGQVLEDQTTIHLPPSISVYLVRDKQTNGAQLNSEDVFLPSGNALDNGVGMFRNMLHLKRFDVLAEYHTVMETEQMQASAGTCDVGLKGRNFVLKWSGNCVTNYEGDGQGIQNISDNSFHVIAFATSSDFICKIYYSARVRFFG